MREYRNPVLPGFFPDPSVCRVGDTFYLVNSSFEYTPGLPLHSSTDLVSWQPIGSVIDRPGQLDFSDAADSGGLFAPTIRHHDGTFYVACTLMGEGPGRGSFYVTATDPAGPWSDPVFLPDATGIDPSLFFDGDRVWWIGCRPAEPAQWPGQTEIWLRELDLGAGALVGDEWILWSGALRNAWWAEGPHLYKRDGWYYLVAAEGGTEFDHAVSVARSRSVTGPYEGNPRNPVFTHRHLGNGAPVQNVGHADLVETADGSWWALLLGTRPIEGHHLLGRETFLTPVVWEDGWPVLNPGVGMLSEVVGTAPATATAPFPTDDFRPSAQRPSSEWMTVRGARLPMLRRLQHHDADVSTHVASGSRLGTAGGLLLRQSDEFFVRIEIRSTVEGWSGRAIVCASGVETVASTVRLGETASDVGATVGVRIRGLRIEPWIETDGARVALGAVDGRVVSTETAGGFVGCTVGPLGDPGVTVSWFDYRPAVG